MGNHTSLRGTDNEGRQIDLSHIESDAPILPAANIEHLQRIDPRLVDLVIEQTKEEANFRRKQSARVNWFIFTERMSGVIAGTFIAAAGIIVSGYVILNGHPIPGTLIGGTTLATIVTVLVRHNKKEEPAKPPPKRVRKK